MNRQEATQVEYAEIMAQACLALCAAIETSERHFSLNSPARAVFGVLEAHLFEYATAAEEVLNWDAHGLTGIEIDDLCRPLGSTGSKVRETLAKYMPNPKERIKSELRQLSAAAEVAKVANVMCALVSSRPSNPLVTRTLRYTQRALDGWHSACEAPASLRPAVGDE